MKILKPLANTVSVTTANQVSTRSRYFSVTTTANTLVSVGPNSSVVVASIAFPAGIYIIAKNTPTDFFTANVAANFTPIAAS